MGEVILEERPNVINVQPSVRADPHGGFLVADKRESQVRRYHLDGSLDFAFGSPGQGPEEFVGAVVSVRLPDQSILVVDRTSKIVTLDPSGNRVTRQWQLPLTNIVDADVIDDSRILFSVRASASRPLLHIWNINKGELERHFFIPPQNSQIRAASIIGGWAFASIQNDTIWSFFSAVDSVYAFSTEGVRLMAVRIPFERFDIARPPRRVFGIRFGSFDEWIGSFHLISSIAALEDLLLIQYGRYGRNPQVSLLGMTTAGARVFEHLLVVTPYPPITAYFQARETSEPNRWIAASIR
ncbi:MAG TPA: hypothetical protein VMM12_04610 [Longimicrobiales bacterium]|nr:hypothetical protein [Longimicrobiales bacterium]